MSVINWIKDNRYTNVFTCTETFGKYKYVVEILVDYKPKTVRFWVALSSGKKRKELDVFEDKENKSFGGIRALFWVKKAILHFPEFYTKGYITEDVKCFICIHWADSRRRNIYKRLEKEGFYFMHIDGQKTLMKEVLREQPLLK